MAAALREDSSGLGNLEAQMEEQVASANTIASENRNRLREQGVTTNDHAAPPSEGSEFDDGLDIEKSMNSSVSHWDPDPGFAYVDGDIEGHGYNKTTVDIIAVPCVGASPVDTWSRDPIGDGYFSFPSSNELDRYPTAMQLPGNSVLSPTINRNLPPATHLWVRQGIRKEVSTARVMLYRHRELAEGMTLDQAADDLLDQVVKMRAGQTKARPIFFICHSIGGLVTKLALVKANLNHELRPLIFDCHGIAFFATPHRGSSYMSMPHLRESIQHLLYLKKPLPRSIARELRIGNKSLLQMHDQFMDIASELRIWTFYETIDSQLSGLGSSDFDEVHFSAPLTSIKSGLLGSRTEQALSLESDHAHCASFGPQNIRTMLSFIADLGAAIRKAEELSDKYVHTPLKLSETVKLELIGFYGDPDSESNQDIRLYISKHRLKDFLEKGPEKCLQERLNTVAARRHKMVPPSRRPISNPSLMPSALGILGNVQELGQKILDSVRPSSSPPEGHGTETPAGQPDIVVTSHASRPSVTGAATEPAISSRRGRGLTVPGLSTPGFHTPSHRGSSETARTTRSDPDELETSPKTGDPSQQLNPSRTEPTGSTIGQKEAGPDMKNRRGRSHGLQDITAGFSRPVASRRKFMWLHMPFNNPHWITKIFNKLSETENQNYSKLLSNENWSNRHVQGRHANLHASYVKPGCAFVPAEIGSPRPPSPARAGRSPSPGISPTYLYLYLPYLHYDTYRNIVRRRNLIQRRMEHGRARPVPKDIAELDSLDSRVIWEYIGHDPPLNTRRTLDQYGYPSLRETYARDDEQMLYKLTKERLPIPFMRKWDVYHSDEVRGPLSALSPGSRLASAAKMFKSQETACPKDEGELNPEDNLLDGNVLMVDQLWLWAVDTTTLMTFFPKRESYPTEGPMFQQADLRNSVYNELNGDLSGRCENALDLAAFVTLHAVTVLIDRTSHPNLEIFRIFEEALGILTERMTLSLKRFRMQTFRDKAQESDSDEPEDFRKESIKQRHKRELERAERENREHTSVLLELRDMDDELTTMKNLFLEQEDTIRLMKEQYEKPELLGYTENGRGFLDEALRRLQDYHKTVHDMIQRVDATKKDYEKLQEMVQRQAQVDEARWSRRQTELASSQNLSVMIFTTFTVLFLPLSFFTSLFGMNTKEWGGDDDNFVSLGEIGLISLPASAVLIGGTLIAAYSSRVQSVVKASYEYTKSGAQRIVSGVTHIGTEDPRRQERRDKLEKETLDSRRRERGFDFWETVRSEKPREYKIPDMNRKRLPGRRLTRVYDLEDPM
ncbi:uncharacterized protein F4807DRAFT_437611 [Annulohypoxylon truncatum]|uniref:uncharacterized protein n=1 Tax=Annulohypoxylon truncatum TaxID=327061 RepID=UPI002008182F|nr:uncharacterized protein F4807DRAFT_437611 [Annulohypoxylon truncatum]KAI1206894.1 hypothetical protein F4807DRAFT_437611 [Annulohypoxylon truncatum]